MTTTFELCCEVYRLELMRGLEVRLQQSGFARVAGVDEAGRGCLAGPVVAAAVIPDPEKLIPGADDSKRLSPAARTELAAAIRETALAFAVVAVPAEVIDRINILQATRLAMRQAVALLAPRPDAVVVDAVTLEDLASSDSAPACLALVKADAWSYAVACASIVAKAERDRMLLELDLEYPVYGFARHKGYGAPDHLAALAKYGPSPLHRLTFRSVLPRLAERAA
ncbi:MAG: ribonuclease HII [Thermoanaerobaculia bacterium]|nr:ribonuclease HII [Thermoanaerobaculia bacterium]